MIGLKDFYAALPKPRPDGIQIYRASQYTGGKWLVVINHDSHTKVETFKTDKESDILLELKRKLQVSV